MKVEVETIELFSEKVNKTIIKLNDKEVHFLRTILTRYNNGQGIMAPTVNGFPAELLKELGGKLE